MQKYKVFLKNQNIIFAFFDFRCIIPRKALFFWSFLVDRNDHFFFFFFCSVERQNSSLRRYLEKHHRLSIARTSSALHSAQVLFEIDATEGTSRRLEMVYNILHEGSSKIGYFGSVILSLILMVHLWTIKTWKSKHVCNFVHVPNLFTYLKQLQLWQKKFI